MDFKVTDEHLATLREVYEECMAEFAWRSARRLAWRHGLVEAEIEAATQAFHNLAVQA